MNVVPCDSSLYVYIVLLEPALSVSSNIYHLQSKDSKSFLLAFKISNMPLFLICHHPAVSTTKLLTST